MTKSRHIAKPRRPWTDAELAILRRDYPHLPTPQISQQLGRTDKMVYSMAKNLGIRKSEAYLASPAACRLRRGDQVGAPWQFKPGFTPWNKGVSGTTGTHPNTAAHHFKAGHLPQTWRPVGSTRITKDGILQRKLTDTRYTPRDWVAVHRTVWEAAHGPIAKGCIVVFKPGRATAQEQLITPDALECITRAENMRRNSVHRHGSELYRLSQLRGAITRQINRRERAQQQPQDQK